MQLIRFELSALGKRLKEQSMGQRAERVALVISYPRLNSLRLFSSKNLTGQAVNGY